MEKQQSPQNALKPKKNIFLGIFFCFIMAVSSMAFYDSVKVNKQAQQALDTIPKNNNIEIDVNLKGLDETIRQSLETAQKALREVDWNKISREVNESMKQVDMAKLQMEIDKSMKAVDWGKMKVEIEKSMKEVDLSKLEIEKSVKNAMKNFNSDEFKRSMEELKKLNFDDVKKDLAKMKIELEINKDQLKLDMDKLKIDMQHLKEGLAEVKEMTNEMEKDGLINKNETNSIEYRNKELFINGKKQTQQASEKYQKYFKGENLKFKLNNN